MVLFSTGNHSELKSPCWVIMISFEFITSKKSRVFKSNSGLRGLIFSGRQPKKKTEYLEKAQKEQTIPNQIEVTAASRR